MSAEEAALRNKLELMKNEYQACRRKLDSKCEALLIVTQELDQCRTERDQFKLMADQLRDRCQTLKQQLSGRVCTSSLASDSSHYVALQCQLEVDSLKQKLADAQEDIRLLRERVAKERLGTSDEAMSARYFSQHEREDLVRQLESSHEQFSQLERDLKRVLDEKEELVTERDAFKAKYNRLNVELNYVLRGDERRIVDVDALCMDNRYLQERLKQMEEEKSAAVAAASKYKHMLERRKVMSILKAPAACGDFVYNSSGIGSGPLSAAVTHKKVEQLLYHVTGINPAVTLAGPAVSLTAAAASMAMAPLSQQAGDDVRSLTFALLDALNDKTLALTHQRKTNKILAGRISDLENKLKAMELSGQCTAAGKGLQVTEVILPASQCFAHRDRTACECQPPGTFGLDCNRNGSSSDLSNLLLPELFEDHSGRSTAAMSSGSSQPPPDVASALPLDGQIGSRHCTVEQSLCGSADSLTAASLKSSACVSHSSPPSAVQLLAGRHRYERAVSSGSLSTSAGSTAAAAVATDPGTGDASGPLMPGDGGATAQV